MGKKHTHNNKSLCSSQFRLLNETLYKGTHESNYTMFKKDPKLFSIYHKGYDEQVKVWPANPLTKIVEFLNEQKDELVVADLGCGRGNLAKSVRQTVFSFDLVSLEDHIIECDICDVPMVDASVDVAVFCLSLMSVGDISKMLLEANRILVEGGKLVIAEVASRFADKSSFKGGLTKLGFKCVQFKEHTNYFYMIHAVKTKSVNFDKKTLPRVVLKPCEYKKR